MAIAVAQQISGTGTTSSTSAHFNNTVVAGNAIIVGVMVNQGTANRVSSVTDSASNTYSKVGSSQTGTGVECEIWASFGVASTGAATQTVTVTAQTSDQLIFDAVEISGLNASGYDRSVGTSGTGTSLDTGASATTRQANEILFVVAAQGNVRPFTQGSGFTMQQQLNSGSIAAAVETQIVSATGAYDGTMTIDTSQNWAILMATFADTAISGGATAHLLSMMGVGN